MAQKLEKMLHSVIFDLLHPRSLVSITIQPLSLDGSVSLLSLKLDIKSLNISSLLSFFSTLLWLLMPLLLHF